jgi:hypothetical protein
LHKGFKCLNVATGRTYILHLVIFYEVFLFSKLHLNAGAKLRSEVQLLPDLFFHPVQTGYDTVVNPDTNVSPANQISGAIFYEQDPAETAQGILTPAANDDTQPPDSAPTTQAPAANNDTRSPESAPVANNDTRSLVSTGLGTVPVLPHDDARQFPTGPRDSSSTRSNTRQYPTAPQESAPTRSNTRHASAGPRTEAASAGRSTTLVPVCDQVSGGFSAPNDFW